MGPLGPLNLGRMVAEPKRPGALGGHREPKGSGTRSPGLGCSPWMQPQDAGGPQDPKGLKTQYSADTVKRDDSRETQTLGGPKGPLGPQERRKGTCGPADPSKRDGRVPSKMGGVSLIVAGP